MNLTMYVHICMYTVNLEIFVVNIFSWSIEATKIKITKLKRMRMLQCGTGSFLRKYFYTKIFPTKISLRENFWIYGIYLIHVPRGVKQ